jgi:hypothetical protein
MQIFLSAFDDVPDPRASNARHDLGELLIIAFVSVLCGSASCAEMAAFGRAKESLFRDFLELKHAIPSHDTFSEVFRVIAVPSRTITLTLGDLHFSWQDRFLGTFRTECSHANPPSQASHDDAEGTGRYSGE